MYVSIARSESWEDLKSETTFLVTTQPLEIGIFFGYSLLSDTHKTKEKDISVKQPITSNIRNGNRMFTV